MDIPHFPSSVVTVGPISVDPLHNSVSVDGKTSRLTPTEFVALHFLVANVNKVCSASQTGSHVWGTSYGEDNPLIKVHIRHLRHKMEPDPSNPTYIRTIPDEGYMLVVEDLP